ncbi:SNF2 family N-terminal domain-containing protein [Myxozyma melibiosi]|uniref:DNA repair protein RAD5 n=1 Tax=Myxozyma melibiosi TaxID=54550 RepID=A0ABR1F6G2_9ASCO
MEPGGSPPIKKRRFFKDGGAAGLVPVNDRYLPENADLVARKFIVKSESENQPSSPDRESEHRSPASSVKHETPISSPNMEDGKFVAGERGVDEHDVIEEEEDRAQSFASEESIVPDVSSGPESELTNSSGFDRELIASLTGSELTDNEYEILDSLSNGDMNSAVNAVFDGTLAKELSRVRGQRVSSAVRFGNDKASADKDDKSSAVKEKETVLDDKRSKPKHSRNWSKRYIGSFQVEGWATRSGKGLISYGETITLKRIARQVTTLGSGSKRFGSTAKAAENDTMVKFTNEKGMEIGRLPTDKARFVSAMMDMKVCDFSASYIFANEKLALGDAIYLQIDCFLLRDAFDVNIEEQTIRPGFHFSAFNRGQEGPQERLLRARQLALIRLFMDCGLKPVQTNDLITAHQARGKLEAEAMAEQFDVKIGSATPPDSEAEVGSSDDDDNNKAIEQDQLDTLYRKAQTYDTEMPEVEPSDTFNMELRPYQKQGLGWMKSMETLDAADFGRQIESMHPLWEEYRWSVYGDETPAEKPDDRFYVNPYSGELSLEFPKMDQKNLGGILADEMGLGKTISTMALIHSNPSTEADRQTKTPDHLRTFAANTTLIIAPMSLLTQWESEAHAASKPGSVRIIVYYGGDRSIDLRNLCLGPDAWKTPVIIITSYGTLSAEWQRFEKGLGNSQLYRLRYLRVVLDEAHTIRNRASLISRSCCEVKADRRWALSGTPIVNRLEDLYALVKFLGIEPWSHFTFWRTFVTTPYESKDYLKALDVVQTILEPILLRRTKSMKQKDGTPLVTLPPKNVYIENIELTETEREVYDLFYRRAKQTFTNSLAAGTVMKSYTTIFAQVLRLRQSCDHPSLVQSAVRPEEVEDDSDDASAKSQPKQIGGLLDSEDDVSLQQLIGKFNAQEQEMNAKDVYGLEVMQQILEEQDRECPICLAEPIVNPVVTSCWHMSCCDCIISHIKFEKNRGQVPRCHSCQAEISEDQLFEVVTHSPPPSSTNAAAQKPEIALRRYKPQSSAKIASLMAKLKAIRAEEPNCKSVVFSQFTSFLDIIEHSLQRERFEYLRLDGSTQQKDRGKILEKFKNEPREMVLLLSLKTGGVGLNLVSANKAFMMDPWWSFAVESQAIDRIHRMGQTQSVTVYRFIVKDSVEERMLKIQDRKKFLASTLGMMTDEQKKAKTIEDIKLLFD